MSERYATENEPQNHPPSADKEVASLRLRLRHLSLSQLEEKELVGWDKSENIVKKGPKFNEETPELDTD